MNIELTPFRELDFKRLISWIDDKKLLVTIAGLDFNFPLDNTQLSNYLNKSESLSFNVVTNENKVVGHAEIILISKNKCKLDKIIIGDKTLRGKGIGEKILNKLLDHAFIELKVNEVELSVYDWNHSAIKCYEKVGFRKNLTKQNVTNFEDIHWTYFNMSIGKNIWELKTGN